MSDNGKNSTGKFLEDLISKRKNDMSFVYNNEALKQRILDGSLSFQFTMTNDEKERSLSSLNPIRHAVARQNPKKIVVTLYQ